MLSLLCAQAHEGTNHHMLCKQLLHARFVNFLTAIGERHLVILCGLLGYKTRAVGNAQHYLTCFVAAVGSRESVNSAWVFDSALMGPSTCDAQRPREEQ